MSKWLGKIKQISRVGKVVMFRWPKKGDTYVTMHGPMLHSSVVIYNSVHELLALKQQSTDFI